LKHKSNVARLDDTDIHDWYRFVFAYSDRVITELVNEFGITQDDLILDPFNGTGTTTVAAKKIGIDAIGTDASPASVLAGRCKTNWDVDIDTYRDRADNLLSMVKPIFDEISSGNDQSLDSFEDDMVEREIDLSTYDLSKPEKTPEGWLPEKVMRKMLVLRHEVDQLPNDEETDLIRLAMIAILPEELANIEFGPEPYKISGPMDKDVHSIFSNRLDKIERDLRRVQSAIQEGELVPGDSEVLLADARTIRKTLLEESDLYNEHGGVDYVITSPPYPAEHDYTRAQRLELVWMGILEDNSDLQKIKKQNIRSNTKNIYVDDNDGERTNIRENERIDAIVSEMEQILEEEDISHWFGQYYPRVVEEYFGGMQCHLEELYDLMNEGGIGAYVVADQASYWQVEIETGEILAELAENRVGFEIEGIKHWRSLHATTGKGEMLPEEILVFRKPSGG
jgi:DNA modification methylase